MEDDEIAGKHRGHKPETTSPRVAKLAGKGLSNQKTSKDQKSVDASALTQAADKKKRK